MNHSRSSPGHQQLLLLEELRRLDNQLQLTQQHNPQGIRMDPSMDLSRLIRADQTQIAALMGGGHLTGYSGSTGASCNRNLDSLRLVDEVSRLERNSGGFNGMIAPLSPHPHRRVADQGIGVSKFPPSPGSPPSFPGRSGTSAVPSLGNPIKRVGMLNGGINPSPSGKRPSIQDEMAIFNFYQQQSKRSKASQSRHDGSQKKNMNRTYSRGRRTISSNAVLPSLTSPRSMAARMTSFQVLWESPTMKSHAHEIRKEVFVRKVARGRVPILDNSDRLPRGRYLLSVESHQNQPV